MTHKIDQIDRKLLYILLKNCRLPNSAIASMLKVSKPVVKYRIDRLEREGIIRKYMVSTARNALGVIRFFIVYLRIRKTKVKEKEAVMKYLEGHQLVTKLFECDGEWNVGFEVSSAIQLEVRPILDMIRDLSNGHMEDLKVFNLANKKFLKRQPFLEGVGIEKVRKALDQSVSFQKELVSAKNEFFFGIARLDDVDLKILSVMRHDARIPTLKLAEKVGCSVNTLKKHIADLIRKGIIQTFTIDIDYSKLRFKHGLILLSVLSDEKRQEQVAKYIEYKYPSVTLVFGYLDYWNMGFSVYFRDADEMDVIVEDILEKFNDFVTDYNKLLITREIKEEFFNSNVEEVYGKAVGLFGG